MNNWRLLLLAVVVVVQPIGSFTESNLIDGRECCERSRDASIYEYRKTNERRSIDGNREDRRTNEERSLQGIREERHYETIRGPMLTRSVSTERSERRNSLELSSYTGLSREQERRGSLARTREAREDKKRDRDELRHILGQNKRNPSESRNRDTLDATRTIRIIRNARVTRSVEREPRNNMSRLQIRRNRSIKENRLLPTRDTTIVKQEQESIARHDTRLSERQGLSSIQLDNNRERRVLNRQTQEDGGQLRGSCFSNARFNRLWAAQTQITVEQSESNNRDYRVVRVELERYQRNIELRDSAAQRETENTSAERMRESMDEYARLAQGKIDIRNNERNNEYRQQNDENRRSIDTRQNNEMRSLGSSEASRSVDMTRRNDVQIERRSHSMVRESIRLPRASDRNTRSERPARTQVVRDESLDERRQERLNNRISRGRTSESRRMASRKEVTESSEKLRRQREIKVIEQSQEPRRSATRRDSRESSEDPRQVNRLSKDMTISALREVRDNERILESTRTVSTENPEEGILRNERENSRPSKSRTISILREVRVNTEQELRNSDMESSVLRQRVNNRPSNNRITMLREDADRKAHGRTERTQESRRVVSPPRADVNFRKIDFRNRQIEQARESSDLRRQVLRRSITSARVTRSLSEERRNNARETFRASRSAEVSRIRENTRPNERVERQQQHDQNKNIVQRVTKVVTPQRQNSRISSRPESIRDERAIRNGGHDRSRSFLVQRVTRNVTTPQRIEYRTSSRHEKLRHEKLVRSPAEIRENERRETRRDDERNDDRSHERVSERRQNREFFIDSQEVRMARNRDVVRSERIHSDSSQKNRAAKDSRIVRRAARNQADLSSERVIVELRSENLSSRNGRREIRMYDRLDSRLQRDATRDSRETSSQRESRDTIERLNVRSLDSVALTEARNARGLRNNERHNRSNRNLNTSDARREATSLRAIKYLTMTRTENRIGNGERKEIRFGNIDSVARDTSVQDSGEPVGDWQMVFYVLQGVYLCGLLIQMLTENATKSKKRTLNWWSSSKNPIKVD